MVAAKATMGSWFWRVRFSLSRVTERLAGTLALILPNC
jgi:hypothetical protein